MLLTDKTEVRSFRGGKIIKVLCAFISSKWIVVLFAKIEIIKLEE